MKKTLIVVALLLGVCLVSRCGGNPNSPGGVYDPGKPIDQNNKPEGPPPPIVPISATVQVFREDCSSNLDSCSNEVQTDNSLEKVFDDWRTYPINNHAQMYTVRIRVVHQQWRERHLSVTVGLPGEVGSTNIPLMEGNTPSPYTAGGAFNLQLQGGQITNTRTVTVSYSEDSWDLLVPNTWRATLGFRYKP